VANFCSYEGSSSLFRPISLSYIRRSCLIGQQFFSDPQPLIRLFFYFFYTYFKIQKELIMAKGLNKQKNEKKKGKTLKEKRAAKREKRN